MWLEDLSYWCHVIAFRVPVRTYFRNLYGHFERVSISITWFWDVKIDFFGLVYNMAQGLHLSCLHVLILQQFTGQGSPRINYGLVGGCGWGGVCDHINCCGYHIKRSCGFEGIGSCYAQRGLGRNSVDRFKFYPCISFFACVFILCVYLVTKTHKILNAYFCIL